MGHTCPPYLNYEELVRMNYINDLIEKKPDIVWVSFGFPKQEEFIDLILKNNDIVQILLVSELFLNGVQELKLKLLRFLQILVLNGYSD